MCGPRVRADVHDLASAADEFFGVNERWPTKAELYALDAKLPRWDMWGREFVFERTEAGGFRVRSAGSDEVLGTDDDIVSRAVRGGEEFAERVRAARRAAGER